MKSKEFVLQNWNPRVTFNYEATLDEIARTADNYATDRLDSYKEALRSAIENRIEEWDKHPQMSDMHLNMIEELREVLSLLDSVTPKE